MSKNTQGYLGPQIGKLGPAVGFLWKGRNIYRSHNPFVRNPKTPAQVEARAKFKLLAQTARLLSPAINLGYAYKADSERTTTRGLFVKENFHLLSYDQGQPDIDMTLLSLADGPLTPVAFGTPSLSDLTLTVPIANSYSGIGCALDSDRVHLLVANRTKDMAILVSAARTDTQLQASLPDTFAGTQVELYGFVTTSVTEPTFIPAYNGNVYPKMSSISTHIATMQV